jgi:3',5'-nucleoside bisphosphate phosphatase
MRNFLADLHIHTTLSPCGDLDMHPARIVDIASQKGLDIIGITDHNSTRHCALAAEIAATKGIMVLKGAEVTTREEVHCLVFFEKTDALAEFQQFLDDNLPDIQNVPEIFGYQVVCDENENIIYEEKKLLHSAIGKSLEEVAGFAHSLEGIFIPAHIDRQKNSIISQLGFLPKDLKADALELSRRTSMTKLAENIPDALKFSIIRSSDAHYPDDIAAAATQFYMSTPSFSEVRMALRGEMGRRVFIS